MSLYFCFLSTFYDLDLGPARISVFKQQELTKQNNENKLEYKRTYSKHTQTHQQFASAHWPFTLTSFLGLKIMNILYFSCL